MRFKELFKTSNMATNYTVGRFPEMYITFEGSPFVNCPALLVIITILVVTGCILPPLYVYRRKIYYKLVMVAYRRRKDKLAKQLKKSMTIYEETISPLHTDDGDSGEGDTLCLICMDTLGDTSSNELVILLDVCSHRFHFKCILKWLDMSDGCPICRKTVDVNDRSAMRLVHVRVRSRDSETCPDEVSRSVPSSPHSSQDIDGTCRCDMNSSVVAGELYNITSGNTTTVMIEPHLSFVPCPDDSTLSDKPPATISGVAVMTPFNSPEEERQATPNFAITDTTISGAVPNLRQSNDLVKCPKCSRLLKASAQETYTRNAGHVKATPLDGNGRRNSDNDARDWVGEPGVRRASMQNMETLKLENDGGHAIDDAMSPGLALTVSRETSNHGARSLNPTEIDV